MWKSIITLIIGAGCIVYGVSMWSVPAAWIITGLMLAVFALRWDGWAEPAVRKPK